MLAHLTYRIIAPWGLICALMFCGCAFAQDITSEEDNGIDLPDFSRTYGYDSRPDVRLHNNNPGATKKKKSFKEFKNKLKNKFSKTGKSGTKYGVQRYTKHTGKKRYGVGVKRKTGKGEKHGITLHKDGLNYEREKQGYNYYLGVDQRKSETSNTAEESTYLFFGIKIRW